MIGWLVLKTGLGRRALILALAACGLLLATGALGLWLRLHDKKVVEAHEAKVATATAERTLAAERSANRADRGREAHNRARSRRIEKEIQDAVTEHPEAASRPVGPAVAGVLNELRRQGPGEDRGAARRAD